MSQSEHSMLALSGGAFLVRLRPAFSHQPLWDGEQRIQRAEDAACRAWLVKEYSVGH